MGRRKLACGGVVLPLIAPWNTRPARVLPLGGVPMVTWGMVIGEKVIGVALRLTGRSTGTATFAKIGIWLTRTWSTLIPRGSVLRPTGTSMVNAPIPASRLSPNPAPGPPILPDKVGSPIVIGSTLMSPTGNTVPGTLKSRNTLPSGADVGWLRTVCQLEVVMLKPGILMPCRVRSPKSATNGMSTGTSALSLIGVCATLAWMFAPSPGASVRVRLNLALPPPLAP